MNFNLILVLLFVICLAIGIILYVKRRINIIKFENEQIANGLVKFVSKYGSAKWGKPQEAEEWKFEEEQIEKGLVKYVSKSKLVKWVTPKQAKELEFEDEQIEKGLIKFESKYKGVRWGTLEQVEIYRNEEEERRRHEDFIRNDAWIEAENKIYHPSPPKKYWVRSASRYRGAYIWRKK